jgi:glycosyltransferase involved in cell wall biosynthesis
MASGAVLAVRRFPDFEGLGLRDGENCVLWYTPAELAALLRDWTRPERATDRAAIREAAAELAHRRFSWDVVTEELLAIVRDFRARRGSA